LVIGATIASLPPKTETVYVGTTTYYYANGTYYAPAPSGEYTVVPAPVGATVQNAPTQVTNVYINGEQLGYSNGAYYEVNEPEKEGDMPTYEVITPPVGASVPELPEGATSKKVNDQAYFVYAETYYKPFYSGSDVIYQVVKDPTA